VSLDVKNTPASQSSHQLKIEDIHGNSLLFPHLRQHRDYFTVYLSFISAVIRILHAMSLWVHPSILLTLLMIIDAGWRLWSDALLASTAAYHYRNTRPQIGQENTPNIHAIHGPSSLEGRGQRWVQLVHPADHLWLCRWKTLLNDAGDLTNMVHKKFPTVSPR